MYIIPQLSYRKKIKKIPENCKISMYKHFTISCKISDISALE
jgi:hypothetical protein